MNSAFGPQWWEDHYQGHRTGHDAPSPQMVAEVTGLPVGTALDAGCGRGTDAVWLAGRGWRVTAVDVSPTAIGDARNRAAAHDISWVVADLTTWQPPELYDLVVSQYVHPTVPFGAFVARLAEAVAPGGTLLVVGHDHADEHSGAHAPERASIGADTVTGALTAERWEVEVAESRVREHARTDIADLVVKARRRRP
jgi:trans-aconitate methyltransferase